MLATPLDLNSLPLLPLPPPPRAQRGFLHVKGKSGLKHTRQLLECWGGRPDLPPLHVIGRFSWDEVKGVVGARNIHIYPNVRAARDGGRWCGAPRWDAAAIWPAGSLLRRSARQPAV